MTVAASCPEPQRDALERRLRGWFPEAEIVSVETIAARPLLPEEAARVAGAVERRRHEFSTGRWLARRGLQAMGLPAGPIGTGPLHEPLWPAGVRGSLTHDGGLCALVLARASIEVWRPIGIDLVRIDPPPGPLPGDLVGDGRELAAAAALGVPAEPALVLFSLKESVVKAVSARVGRFLDLREIELDPAGPVPARVGGEPVPLRLHVAVEGRYLLSAARGG